jgi:cell division protein FtsL
METTGSQIDFDALCQKVQALELKIDQQGKEIIELKEQIKKQSSSSADDIIKIRDADARRMRGLR